MTWFLPTPAFLMNFGLTELLCIGMVVLLTFFVIGAVLALIAVRSRRRDCPHCGTSHPRSVTRCSKCGQSIE